MECQECEDFLSEYMEGELRGDARHCIEEHLSSCHGCHAKFTGIHQLRNILRSLRCTKPSTHLDFTLQRLIHLEACHEYGFLQRLKWRLSGDRLPFVLTVAAVIVVLFVTTHKIFQPDQGLFARSSHRVEVLPPSIEEREVTNYVLERIAPSELPFHTSGRLTTSITDTLSIKTTSHFSTQTGYIIF
jgi:hypothetical protein